jgi:hypothetical protein
MVRASTPIELKDGDDVATPFVLAEQPQAFTDAMLSTGLIARLTPRGRLSVPPSGGSFELGSPVARVT